MASLSNINGLFDVHSTGAILFSTSHGTSGQILRSNGNAAPTWVAASTVIGGPYLPLTGGALSGPLSGTSATFSGVVNTTSGYEKNGYNVIGQNGTTLRINNAAYWQQLELFTNGTSRLTIQANGNTGIGTSTPTNGKLVIASTQNNSNDYTWLLFDNKASGYGDWSVYKSGNNDLSFGYGTDNGASYTNALTLEYGGNVGIGTDNPVTKLHLGGATNTALTISKTGDLSTGLQIGRDSVTLASYIIQRENADLFIRTNNIERMRIDSSGNVGINEDNPDKKLHIVDTSAGAVTYPLRLQNSGTTTGTDVGLIFTTKTSNGGSASCVIRSESEDAVGNNSLVFTTSSSGSTTEKMRIDSSGRVGIGTGTATLDEIFEIKAGNGAGGDPATNAPVMKITNNTTSSDWDVGDKIGGIEYWTRDPSGNAPYVTSFINSVNETGNGTLPSGALVFGTATYNAVGGAVERMRIDSNGFTTITTNGAGASLTISQGGSISINENVGYLNFYSNDVSTTSSGGVGGIGVYGETAFTGNTPSYMSFFTHANSANDGTVLGNVTERMRITSGGTIQNSLINSTVSSAFKISTNAGGGNFIYGITIEDDSTNTGFILFAQANGSAVGSILRSGSSTVYNTTSDYRLKEDLQDFNGLDKVSKIPVYDFKWKTDESRSYGVMAHELQEVLPDAVSGEKDAEEMQGVDYSKIVPLLVKSIQELKAEIEILKNK